MLARVKKVEDVLDEHIHITVGKRNYVFTLSKREYQGLTVEVTPVEGEPGIYWLSDSGLLFHESWLEFENSSIVTDDEAFIGEDQ